MGTHPSVSATLILILRLAESKTRLGLGALPWREGTVPSDERHVSTPCGAGRVHGVVYPGGYTVYPLYMTSYLGHVHLFTSYLGL